MGLIKGVKNSNKPLLGQIMDMIPSGIIREATQKFKTDHYIKKYRTRDQLVAMLFGQLNHCLTLRDILAGFNVSLEFLKGVDMNYTPARSTMSDGHKNRNWCVYEEIFNKTLKYYKRLFSRTASANNLVKIEQKAIRIVDSSTLPLCLSLFPWARFRTAKGAVKIHMKLDQADCMPDVVYLSEGSMHDKKAIPYLDIKSHSVIIDDRAYYDFTAFVDFCQRDVSFVTRLKSNADYQVIRQETLTDKEKEMGIRSAKVIRMVGKKAIQTTLCEKELRLVSCWNQTEKKEVEILTNNAEWSVEIVSELYRKRWKIETFFKGLKQNLNLKTFIGTSENAVKSQIYIALLAYVMIEFIRNHMSKVKHSQKQFFNLIRICLTCFQGLKYVISEIDLKTHAIAELEKQNDQQISLFNTS